MSFSKNITAQALFMNDLNTRYTALVKDQQQFSINQETAPNNAQWEAAWTAAGNVGKIPLNKPLVWTWKGTLRGEYTKAANNLFGFASKDTGVLQTIPTADSVIDRLNIIGWYDNDTVAASGTVFNSATNNHTTGTYQVYADGSRRLITTSRLFAWLPNQKKGLFASGTDVQRYDEVLNTFTTLFSSIAVAAFAALNPANTNQFMIVGGARVGFWNGSSYTSWVPTHVPFNLGPAPLVHNNFLYYQRTSDYAYVRYTFTGTGATVTALPRTIIPSPYDPTKIWRFINGYQVTESLADLSAPVTRTVFPQLQKVILEYKTKERLVFSTDSLFEMYMVAGVVSGMDLSPDGTKAAANGLYNCTVFRAVTPEGGLNSIIRTTAYSEPDPDQLTVASFTLDAATISFTVDFTLQMSTLDNKYGLFQLVFQNTATNNGNMAVSFNGDEVAANYENAHTSVVLAVWTNGATSLIPGVFVQTGNVNSLCRVMMWLMGARDSIYHTTALYIGANATSSPSMRPITGVGVWKNTATPTVFTFTLPSGTFPIGTQVELIAFKTKGQIGDASRGGVS